MAAVVCLDGLADAPFCRVVAQNTGEPDGLRLNVRNSVTGRSGRDPTSGRLADMFLRANQRDVRRIRPAAARGCIAALVLAMVAAGCTVRPNTRPERGAELTKPLQAEIWEYPASAFPATCMILGADGSLRFRGGFLFFSPGRWSRDEATGTTSVVLGGDTAYPIESAGRQKRDYVAATKPFDPRTRTLRYRITATDTAMEFAGLVFHRSTTCSAA